MRALRLDLAAEEEVVHLQEATDNELAKKVLRDIANEDRVRKEEFQRLIAILARNEDALLTEGAEEVNEMAAETKPEEETSESQPSPRRSLYGCGSPTESVS